MGGNRKNYKGNLFLGYMEEKSLEKIGLTKNETKVYLALLKIGTSKVGEILKESKLNSGKIYEVINSLEQKGLVSESTINNVKHFTATSPKRLLDYIEDKKKELAEETSLVKSLLPSLENLSEKKQNKIKVLTYIGFEGLKTAVDEAIDSMKQGEEICAMSVTHKKEKKFNDFWINLNNKRIAKKIRFRPIFSEKQSDFYKIFKKMPLTSIRVFDLFPQSPISIYGKDKVLINLYEEPAITLLIYSEKIANTFKKIFEEIWKMSKK